MLHVLRRKDLSFVTAIIGHYRRGESSEEAEQIEMVLAGVSVRRIGDIAEALWSGKVPPSMVSELNKKAYVYIEGWRRVGNTCMSAWTAYLPTLKLRREG